MDYAQRPWTGARVEKVFYSQESSRSLRPVREGVEELSLKGHGKRSDDQHEKNGVADMNEIHWYAAKVKYNRTQPIREQLTADRVRYYVPEVIGSLVFLQVSEDYLSHFEQDNFSRLWLYRNPLTHKPSPIPDREMEVFMFVCSAGKQGLTFLGDDKPEYHLGDRVRVTEGPLKGAEGHIKRIKKDRRLVVSISGVAAVATTYIHPQFLEAID